MTASEKIIRDIRTLQRELPPYGKMEEKDRKALRHEVYKKCGRGPLVERIFTEEFQCGSEVFSVESSSF